MNSTFTFTTIHASNPGGYAGLPKEWFPILRVDSAVACGAKFEGVALIVGADSPNPAIMLPKPLGFNAVEEIMKLVRSAPDIGWLTSKK